MIIDAHTHIFSPEIAGKREIYCSKDACFNLLYADTRAKLLQAEDLIRSMDDNGIEKSVVLNIGWMDGESCKRNNDYIIESVLRYPGRLIGYCSVQPLERDNAARELERCFKEGIRGVGELRPDEQGYDLDNVELLAPMIDIMARHDAVLSLHASEPVGHNYAGKGNITPGRIYSFIKRHHGLKLVLAHFGGGLPFYELMPEVRAELENTYYDTAAAPFLYTSAIYQSIIGICGGTKLLYGSDWPLLEHPRGIKHIGSAALDQFDMHNILSGNAERLLNLI